MANFIDPAIARVVLREWLAKNKDVVEFLIDQQSAALTEFASEKACDELLSVMFAKEGESWQNLAMQTLWQLNKHMLQLKQFHRFEDQPTTPFVIVSKMEALVKSLETQLSGSLPNALASLWPSQGIPDVTTDPPPVSKIFTSGSPEKIPY